MVEDDATSPGLRSSSQRRITALLAVAFEFEAIKTPMTIW